MIRGGISLILRLQNIGYGTLFDYNLRSTPASRGNLVFIKDDNKVAVFMTVLGEYRCTCLCLTAIWQPTRTAEYDDGIIRSLIDSIRVTDDLKLIINVKGGTSVTEDLHQKEDWNFWLSNAKSLAFLVGSRYKKYS